jgi:hypothetical protein
MAKSELAILVKLAARWKVIRFVVAGLTAVVVTAHFLTHSFTFKVVSWVVWGVGIVLWFIAESQEKAYRKAISTIESRNSPS